MITAGLFAVLAAGGALLRWVPRRAATTVRRAAATTLVVNLTGAFALGLLVGSGPDAAVLTVVGVGALGSYTTFSTMVSDVVALAETQRRGDAALYLLATIVGGVALADLGLRLTG